jgi:DNA-damage-inducible protein J
MMIRMARERALPFEPLIPTAETIAAIEAAERGEFDGTYTTVEELMESLFEDN